MTEIAGELFKHGGPSNAAAVGADELLPSSRRLLHRALSFEVPPAAVQFERKARRSVAPGSSGVVRAEGEDKILSDWAEL